MTGLPSRVHVCECWARDGLQSWPRTIPADDKIAVLAAARDAGVREFDATALVPEATAPQFADAEAVLAWFAVADADVRVLVPNVRGAERAIELHHGLGVVDTIGIPISASEAHNLANVRRSHRDHLEQIEQVVRLAHAAGVGSLVAVATAYGCPLTGLVEEDVVFDLARQLVDLGVDRLMLSDTTGLADPVRARSYAERARRDFPNTGLVAHFHDTRGAGLANTFAAIEGGVTVVDTCLGGIGGEPDNVAQGHAGETGNLSTQDLVVLLERSGVTTGIDPDLLLVAGRLAERTLGANGRSQVQRTGHGLQQSGWRLRPTTGSAPAAAIRRATT